MTDHEKAVVMAYTGTAMLVGEKLDVFYRYVAEKLGRPVYSHELANDEVQEQIKRASFEDFKRICNDEFVEETSLKTFDISRRMEQLEKQFDELKFEVEEHRRMCI